VIYFISKKNQWSKFLFEKLKNCGDYFWYSDDSYKAKLTEEKPEWLFFFHWSKIVPKEIYENYKCVVIHTGNLPKDRGGSPLQNQILKKQFKSRVNLIEMGSDIDAGDVYCSLPITLYGSLTDIWLAISETSFELINRCVKENMIPKPQEGVPSFFKRRKPKDSLLNFSNCDNILEIHKFIQMLDAEGYPNAYYDIGDYRLHFSRSSLTSGEVVLADVKIGKKK
tara:strand:+ start:5387 stop:6058 length:672 start_codon:yes stop_codon:yes gene_type:complete